MDRLPTAHFDECQVPSNTVTQLFATLGGVTAYLDGIRLERRRADLRQAEPWRTKVADVAASWGFSDPAEISRRRRTRRNDRPCPTTYPARKDALTEKRQSKDCRFLFLERETRLELATPTLARLCSTN